VKGVTVPLLLILSASAAVAQEEPAPGRSERDYPFILFDSPAGQLTMRQVDQDYLSGYRLFASLTNKEFRPAVSYLIQGAACLFLFKTMTHEEGHRAILRGEGIDSGTRPFLFENRGGYVDGVTDQTLQNLRDMKFPTFVRLHTAGFESDYMLATREETLLAFEEESFKNLMIEYWFRKAAPIIYFTEYLFKRNTDGPEEANELERDIVGNDLYGVIRHLFRPTMPFKRYTRYQDLTDDELQYLERVEWRTFLNLANANIIGIRNFRLTADVRGNFGMGHSMGPFGDYIDEKVWLTRRQKLKVSAYLREFENRDHWFFGAGAGVLGYPLTRRLSASVMVHYWNQPFNLSFVSPIGKPGGALDLSGSYKLMMHRKSYLRYLSLDIGVICKTAGFLPEETALGAAIGPRVGLSLGLPGN
jgi:hypothetical protein